MQKIKEIIEESINVKKSIINDKEILERIQTAADMIKDCINNGNKVLICGNGGSASDALHITGELVGRFQKERKSMASVCLNADVATMTAIANDYGYEYIFSRAVEGIMKRGDILIGISTSGNSVNVYNAVKSTAEIGGKSIALLGKTGGKINEIADLSIIIPSDNTARIQESHIMIGHIICEQVEAACN